MRIKELQPYIYIFENKKLHSKSVVQDARDKIIISFSKIVDGWVVAMFENWKKWVTEDELKTAGLYALIHAVDTFDGDYIGKKSGRKMKLKSWVYYLIHNSMYSVVRKNTMKKRKHNGVYSIHNPLTATNNDETEMEYLDILVSKDNYFIDYINSDYMQEVRKKLSPKDLKLFDHYIKYGDDVLRKSCKRLNISCEALRCRRIRLIKKIIRIMKNK
jgi:hypothetical protein